MTNFTPGPWEFSTTPQPNGCPIIGANGLMVAMLAHSINQLEQKETALANARLIAAAPDLLGSLLGLIDAFSLGPLGCAAKYGPDADLAEIERYAFESALSAIAKATGKDNA